MLTYICVTLSELQAHRDAFIQNISFSLRLGHSAVLSIVQDVCKSNIKHLTREVMPTLTRTTWSQIVNDFRDLWNFRNWTENT